MTNSRPRRWALAPAGLIAAAVLAGCTSSADETSGKARPGPPTPASVSAAATAPAPATGTPSPSRTSPSPAPHRTAGDGTASCYDGSCTVTVTRPVTIAVDPHRFGFSSFRVTSISAAGVGIEAVTSGTRLQSSGSPGSRLTLNSLTVRILSSSAHEARLEVSG
jgi:hypothetical protein